jgi:hypothetical protein
MARIVAKDIVTYILPSGERAFTQPFRYVGPFREVNGRWVAVARYPAGRTLHITPDGRCAYRRGTRFSSATEFEQHGSVWNAIVQEKEESLLIDPSGKVLARGYGIRQFLWIDCKHHIAFVEANKRGDGWFIDPTGSRISPDNPLQARYWAQNPPMY